VSLLRDAQGKCNGVIAMFTDLTETKRLEREAELNRQMASLGELTAGVVHELRNPLGAISGMAELLGRNTSLDESNAQILNSIVDEIAQLDRTITHFLAFGKPFELQLEHVTLSDVIERALRLGKRRIHSKHVTVAVNVNDDVPPLRADSTKLVQAIVNLLVNSVEAVPEGGEIRVDVSDSHPSGESIVLSVSDNGPGVPVEEREKILRPFYSQKESGTGLGVSIVHRIVTAHGGSLEVGDSDMGGARFTLRLPRPDTRE
jgi:signal transduction histidine kinase